MKAPSIVKNKGTWGNSNAELNLLRKRDLTRTPLIADSSQNPLQASDVQVGFYEAASRPRPRTPMRLSSDRFFLASFAGNRRTAFPCGVLGLGHIEKTVAIDMPFPMRISDPAGRWPGVAVRAVL